MMSDIDKTQLMSAIRVSSAPADVWLKVGIIQGFCIGSVERGPGTRTALAVLLREVADEIENSIEED